MAGVRMMVTIPREMIVAIDILAQQNGIAPSTQARQLLRQSLARTMASAEYIRRCEAQGITTQSGRGFPNGI